MTLVAHYSPDGATIKPPSTVAELPPGDQAEIGRHYEHDPLFGWSHRKSREWTDESELVARFLAYKAKRATTVTPAPDNDNIAKVTETAAAAVPPPVEPVELPPARTMPLVDVPSEPAEKLVEPAPAYAPKAGGIAARATGGMILLPHKPRQHRTGRRAPVERAASRKPSKPGQMYAVDVRNAYDVAELDKANGCLGQFSAAHHLLSSFANNPWDGRHTAGRGCLSTYGDQSKPSRAIREAKPNRDPFGMLLSGGFMKEDRDAHGAVTYRLLSFSERTTGTCTPKEDAAYLAWFNCDFARGNEKTPHEDPRLLQMRREFKSAAHLYAITVAHQMRSMKAPAFIPSNAIWQPYSATFLAGNGETGAWAFTKSSGRPLVNEASEVMSTLAEDIGHLDPDLTVESVFADLVAIGSLTVEPIIFESMHKPGADTTPNVYVAMDADTALKVAADMLEVVMDHSTGLDMREWFGGFSESLVVPVVGRLAQPEARGVYRLAHAAENKMTAKWIETSEAQKSTVVEMARQASVRTFTPSTIAFTESGTSKVKG
jgi:hypothetical protein